MSYKVGVDIGGTFTDFVVMDSAGRVRLYKVPSRRGAPDEAIREGIEQIAAELTGSTTDFLHSCELAIHGTTVATNVLIQNNGARTGLLCAEGFRDSFELRLGFKEERYDFAYPPPPLLVPRERRLPVRGRIDKKGRELIPIDEEQARLQVRALRAMGVEAVAVCFPWSFLNPAHEEKVRSILDEEMPEVFVSCSVDVLPQIREYDRVSTTVVNAYVGPSLVQYVDRVESLLRGMGYRNPIRYIQANAGCASAEALRARPIYALNSGPAAGPTAGLHFGRQMGFDNVIVGDMGGTSFDVSLAVSGSPDVVKNVDVHRYRIGIPMMNVNTIGAGGGSIAWVDTGGILRVGPRSAEAVPGPACYGRGGTEPTVTDANVVLGYFSPLALLGGRLQMNADAARKAIETHVGGPLELSVEEASNGIFDIVNHNMSNGIREVSVERGHDPRDFALVIGGGAGAVHAGRLAMELEIPIVIIPRVASALCAFGEVVADLRHDYQATYAVRLRDADSARLTRLFAEMEVEGRTALASEGVTEEAIAIERTLEMRYVGQVHECPVPISWWPIGEGDVGRIEQAFHAVHEAKFGYADREGGVCELINTALAARGGGGEVSLPGLPEGDYDPDQAELGSRHAYFPEMGGFVETAVYDGARLEALDVVRGPAVIEEETTTIVVFPGSEVRLDPRGFYVMTFTGTTSPMVTALAGAVGGGVP